MTSHPSPKQLAAYLDGETDPATAEAICSHVDSCPTCRAVVSQMRWLRQAIRATLPGPIANQPPKRAMTGIKRRVSAAPQSVQAILLVGPVLFTLAAVAAKMIIVAVVGDNLLQRAGITSSGPARLSRWALRAATSDTLQRTVGDPLGLSQEQFTATVTDLAARLEGVTSRPLVPALLLVIPMALISGIAILALCWFFCWTSGNRQE